MDKQRQWNVWYFIGAFLLLMLFQSWWTTSRSVEAIPYSDFLTYLEQGRITELQVTRDRIVGRLNQPINGNCNTSDADHANVTD